jgi:protein-disulfide isomerase
MKWRTVHELESTIAAAQAIAAAPEIAARSTAGALMRILLLAIGATSCGGSASPDQQFQDRVRSTLKAHPEIVYDAIKARPAEFMAFADSVARSVRGGNQGRSATDEARRIDAEFAAPKHPSLDHRIAFGAVNAPVTIVEYTDFECPFCREEAPVLVELMKKYGDRVRLVVKQTPMDFHPHAMPAALMFEAIVRQDAAKALRFYDLMYAKQERFASEGDAFVNNAAREVGADLARAQRDAASPEIGARVASDLDEARRFGFNGTPGFLINGVSLEGAYPLAAFERIIDRHLNTLSAR